MGNRNVSPNDHETEPLTKGQWFLEEIGYGELIGRQFTYVDKDGNEATDFTDNFLEICGAHVANFITLLETLNPDDPLRMEVVAGSRVAVEYYCHDLVAENHA